MFIFKNKHVKTRILMLYVLSSFIIVMPIIGHQPSQSFDLHNNESESVEVVNAVDIVETYVEPSSNIHDYYFDSKDHIILENELIARTAVNFSVLGYSQQAVPFEPDLEHDLTYSILNLDEFDPETSELLIARDDIVGFTDVEYTLYISASRLNLRAGPTLFANVLTQLKFGDKVLCLGENDEWMKVSFEDKTGYISRNFTSKEMVFRDVKETMYVTSSKLNMRAAPNTESKVVSELSKNNKLTRTGIGDGWSRVKTPNGKLGYVVSDYLTNKAPVPDADTITIQARTNSSAEEVALFTKIVALESSSRYGYEGYLAVATVIMNRVDSRRFPNTITKVVSQPGQFCTYTTTRKPHYNNDVRRAVKDALEGKRNLPKYVLFFAMPYAYERNADRGGVFAKLDVYNISYGHVWCYYPEDRK